MIERLYGESFQVEMTSEKPLFWWTVALRAPGMAAEANLQQVPADYWTQDTELVDEVQVQMAVVRCPCGQEPIVERFGTRQCHGCSRHYAFTGQRVYVTNSPKHRKPRWLQITDDWRRSSRSQS